ncbi:MAG: sulfatase-like hydrolase/transferase, partial [Bdellovibrionota bacterium]
MASLTPRNFPRKSPKLMALMLAVAGLLGISGCSLTSGTQPAVLVLVVQNLGFNSFSCDDTAEVGDTPGFDSFCQEAVRYTHAYSVSTLSQATVGSLLTGLYPREHGVRHNGAQGLNPALETVAEVALKKGFATSFFSGGPPVWRRGAFSQGFATFDDNVQVSLKKLYRPANSVVDLFLKWQETEARRSPFLSFLFFADAQFFDQPTVNDLGEIRESTYRAQLEEVGESMSNLVTELKRRKIWDSSYVILVGLDGKTSGSREDEPSGSNLYSESTHVTLMIKPARKKRESPFNWKIDANVSLVDVGATLFDILDGEQVRLVSRAGAVSLKNTLVEPVPDWPIDRKIITESAWPEWRGYGGVRASVRKGPYLYIFDTKDKLYNTLTDSLEVSLLPKSDPRAAEVREELANYLVSFDYAPWAPSVPSVLESSMVAEDLWRTHGPAAALYQLENLARRYPDDARLRGWRAIIALENSNWKELIDVARDTRPIWKYVGEVNSGIRSSSRKPVIDEPCVRAIVDKFQKALVRKCSNETARELLSWASASNGEEQERAKETFFRRYLDDA